MTNFWKNLKKSFTVLAPMEGVTDYVFRELISTKLPSPEVFFTEFTSSDGLASKAGHLKTLAKLKYSKRQRPIVAQIWGTNPIHLRYAAKICSQLKFDGIDINMGCPDRAVVKAGAGAAMCLKPELAAECVRAVKDGARNLPVSVKTRIGFNKIITEDWIGNLLSLDLAALTVHGRTASQKSDVAANWNEISKAVEIRNKISPSTILIGNGDVKDRIDGEVKCRKFGVDGVMIGRGIFSNPWAFDNKVHTHKTEEYLDLLKNHFKLFEKTRGEYGHFDSTKKFVKMYIREFPKSAEVREKIMQTKTIQEALSVIDATQL